MAASQMWLVVDDDKVNCLNAGFMHIQDDVNAASPGATIRVCQGIYVEQISINKPLAIEADSGAFLTPSAMQQNATSLFDATGLATAILVSDTNGVTIRGLVVDGANAGHERRPYRALLSRVLPDQLNGWRYGIFFFPQSSRAARAARAYSCKVAAEGCRKWPSTTARFAISRKNGIAANEVGTDVSIDENVVTGIGPTPGAAQNGIKIGFGAGGRITGNTVTNNVWSPCTGANTCGAVATNILVTQSDGVTVLGNTVGINQVGIFIHGNQAQVEQNKTFLSSVFDGILVEGNQAMVRGNLFNGSEAGILVDGNNNVIEQNTMTEAPICILKVSGSTGNLIHNNLFFGAPLGVRDPADAKTAGLISPVRC
jgi:nitrous oxidase accessory protein NosD